MILAALLLLQDAAPLPPVVESWYRLLDGERHVGWVHEALAGDAYSRRLTRAAGRSTPAESMRRLFDLRRDGKLAIPGDVDGLRVEPMRTIEAWGRPVRITPVRFPEGELTEAWVDRYGRIVEASCRDGLRLTLVRTETEAVGDLPPPSGRTSCGKTADGRWFCVNHESR